MTTLLNADRSAETNDIHDLLRKRRSPRAYSPQSVEPEKLSRLFEAARWAPSASNEQPWRFVVATKDRSDDFVRVLSTSKEGNRAWAQHAPVLVISVAKTIKDKDDSVNRHAFHDVGQAVAHLSIQAVEEGLSLRQMGGFDAEIARERLNIPAGYEAVAAIAIGYPGDIDTLPDGVRERELAQRVRKPLTEIVYGGAWDRPLQRPLILKGGWG